MNSKESLNRALESLKEVNLTRDKAAELLGIKRGRAYIDEIIANKKNDADKTGAINSLAKSIEYLVKFKKLERVVEEFSSAREPDIPYGVNTRVQLSLKALKEVVAQLEADLSLPKTEESDINKAASKAYRVRKSNKSVSGK